MIPEIAIQIDVPDSKANALNTPPHAGYRRKNIVKASAVKLIAIIGLPANREIATNPGSSAKPTVKIKAALRPSTDRKTEGISTRTLPVKAGHKRAKALLLPMKKKIPRVKAK
jgi:hypothetical protein